VTSVIFINYIFAKKTLLHPIETKFPTDWKTKCLLILISNRHPWRKWKVL